MLKFDPRLLVILLCIGCAAGTMQMEHYGDMKPSAAVKAAFEGYVMDDTLVYYFTGPDAGPTGLMGIEQSHALESQVWRRIGEPQQALKGLIRNMQSKADEYGLSLYGFDIRDDEGNDIGDWYSILDGRMPVKITGEKRVMVYPPSNDLYERVRYKLFGTEDY